MTTTDTAPNPWEQLARERKAAALAATFRAHGIPAEVVAYFDEDGRRIAAQIARVHPPGQRCWERVVQLLELDEQAWKDAAAALEDRTRALADQT